MRRRKKDLLSWLRRKEDDMGISVVALNDKSPQSQRLSNSLYLYKGGKVEPIKCGMDSDI